MELGELPQGWLRAKFSDVIEPRGEKALPSELPNLPFLGMDHVEAQTTRILGSVPASSMKSSAARFFVGDVLYGRLRPYLNKVAQPNFHGLASAEFIVFPDTELLHSKFLRFRLNALDFVSFASHLNEGDRPRVNFEQIGEFELLVPPPAEQHRIVAKIEELFSELDQGVASLKAAREQLKVYRQSLLKNAFAGKLTAAWRAAHADQLETAAALQQRIARERTERHRQQLADWQANGQAGPKPKPPKPLPPLTPEELADLPKLPAGWGWWKFGQLFGVYVGATPSRKKSAFWAGSIPWVSSGEVAFRRIGDTREKITPVGFANASTELHPPGTVMLAMIGEGKTRGQAAILDIGAAHNQNTAAIRVSEAQCSPEFVYHYLAYQYETTRKLGSGNNQKALNKERVSEMKLPLCGHVEMAEVVNQIEEKLSEADHLDKTLATALQQAEALRQSILKKAFCGQLVKQDKNDEPASALLERIRAGKSNGMNTPRNRRKSG